MLWSNNVECQVYARLVQNEVVVEEDNVAWAGKRDLRDAPLIQR